MKKCDLSMFFCGNIGKHVPYLYNWFILDDCMAGEKHCRE